MGISAKRREAPVLRRLLPHLHVPAPPGRGSGGGGTGQPDCFDGNEEPVALGSRELWGAGGRGEGERMRQRGPAAHLHVPAAPRPALCPPAVGAKQLRQQVIEVHLQGRDGGWV